MAESISLPDSLNLEFTERLYAQFQRDPASVSPEWQRYFEGLNGGEAGARRVRLGPSFRPASLFGAPRRAAPGAGAAREAALQYRVDLLVWTYRLRGHTVAKIDPLHDWTPYLPELDPESYRFTEEDLERRFTCETMRREGRLTLREILARLRDTYCRSIAVQFMHIDDLPARHWLQERMESTGNRLQLTREEQLRILTRLTDAVTFEEFIRKRFIGAKTFSLEGCESLVPLLDLAIEHAGEQGVEEIVLAMAHRGRLNVLANLLGKSPREIFREFEEADPDQYGDVKYHLGHHHDWRTSTGRTVRLELCFNPSHLEFVNPVALGRTRARQDRAGDTARARRLALLIHGDAAFIAQGVVQETLNLSRLPAYSVGGTLHVIVNNQLGFTTPPHQGRSTMYATSVAKMLPAPIFHVNGEDPEAVAQCVRLALDFRHRFHLDVVIDMYGYRRFGHNEGDEPTFTQPRLYRAIARRPSVREGYLEHLLALGELTRAEADAIAQRCRDQLEQNLSAARQDHPRPTAETAAGVWKGYSGGAEPDEPETSTGVKRDRLAALLEAQSRLPPRFSPHPKIQRAIELRLEMARGARPLDWSAAESLALASLATEGVRVRLSGQDSERGTFSQRHAVLHDFEDGQTYVPLQHLAADQAPVEIYNSPLSETAVLGFEYGYSLDRPDALVLWEAQYGDFVNAAQVIVDQFLASAEAKWRRLSGLVLLLPHGFEGQGPEHSSARLERFLQLAAEDNLQIVYPSTPAQYFHGLRRQALRRWRKPLVLMTPKSLLRHPQSVSSLDELARGAFQRVIPAAALDAPVERVLLCSGKIYFDLEQRRQQLGRADVAIVRLEQLYPFPAEPLQAALAACGDHPPVFWVQEAPANMGPWSFLREQWAAGRFERFALAAVCRPAAASPASGSTRRHEREHERLLEQAVPDRHEPGGGDGH